MNSRSKKYHAFKRSDSATKKGSANKGGYNEQQETTIKKPNEHPAASESEEKIQSVKEKDES